MVHGWQSWSMALTWQIDADSKTILLEFTEQALAADLETYNLVLAAESGLIDFDHLIVFGETNCDELVYIDLIRHIEQWVKTIVRWHHPRVAITSLDASEDQLARFFCATTDLVAGSEAIDFYITRDKADALAWLSRGRP